MVNNLKRVLGCYTDFLLDFALELSLDIILHFGYRKMGVHEFTEEELDTCETEDLILKRIVEKYQITVQAIRSKDRSENLDSARLEAYRALRKFGLSFPKIGKIMWRDHSTVQKVLRYNENRTSI
jgi:chromosomal replication initiation ATPase DnaA